MKKNKLSVTWCGIKISFLALSLIFLYSKCEAVIDAETLVNNFMQATTIQQGVFERSHIGSYVSVSGIIYDIVKAENDKYEYRVVIVQRSSNNWVYYGVACCYRNRNNLLRYHKGDEFFGTGRLMKIERIESDNQFFRVLVWLDMEK